MERVQALADISRSGYVVITMKSVHRLQIRLLGHNQRAPPTVPQVASGYVQQCGNAARQTDTDGRDRYTFRLGYASRENNVIKQYICVLQLQF